MILIRAIAALVSGFRGMSEKRTAGVVGGLCCFAERELGGVVLMVALGVVRNPCRWVLKQDWQYTGLPWVGRNGTIVGLPHWWQVAW